MNSGRCAIQVSFSCDYRNIINDIDFNLSLRWVVAVLILGDNGKGMSIVLFSIVLQRIAIGS